MAEVLHPEPEWPKTPGEALEQQRWLAALLPPELPLGPVSLVGGLDVSYSRRLGRVFAALVVAHAIFLLAPPHLRLVSFHHLHRALAQPIRLQFVLFPAVRALLDF